jgi:hypothetical protein
MAKNTSGGWFSRLFRIKTQPPQRARTANPYHAVSIVPGENACAAAHRFTGQRFLAAQAPRLPLPTCDAAYCACRFKHHRDRRAGPRRRSDIGLLPAHYSGEERRRSRGRRSTDQ